MFEKAVRNKLRWNYKGSLNVEDLWALEPYELNELYMKLAKDARASAKGLDSLIDVNEDDDSLETLRMDIVKHIFMTKKAEADSRQMAAIQKQKSARIIDIIARKKDAELEALSVEELEKLIP